MQLFYWISGYFPVSTQYAGISNIIHAYNLYNGHHAWILLSGIQESENTTVISAKEGICIASSTHAIKLQTAPLTGRKTKQKRLFRILHKILLFFTQLKKIIKRSLDNHNIIESFFLTCLIFLFSARKSKNFIKKLFFPGQVFHKYQRRLLRNRFLGNYDYITPNNFAYNAYYSCF